jgi:hypothetical protein
MAELAFEPIQNREANVDFFWKTIEDLSLHHLALSQICNFIEEPEAECTYVEGWLPESLKSAVLVWLRETGKVAFNVSVTHGMLVPKTVASVTCALRSSGVWFRRVLDKSYIDKISAFTDINGAEVAVAGWYDSSVPAPKSYLMFHNGYEIEGRLLYEPPRNDIEGFGKSFLVSFKIPPDALDRISLRDYPEFAIEGQNRVLYVLNCPNFGERFERVEAPARSASNSFGIWQKTAPQVYSR